MRRLQLLELEDQPWFPAQIRNCMTDLLNFFVTFFRIYDPVVPILHKVMKDSGSSDILDLCSGGGGAVRRIKIILENKYNLRAKVILSDLYPNKHALLRDPSISYLLDSVDATDVPSNLKGFRTLFTSFHHFDPTNAKKILGDAVKQERGIAIFELSERSFRGALGPIFSFVLSFLATPFLRPFRLQRLFYTYLVPIVPAAFLFDGIVSQMRSYTPAEMLLFAQEIDDKNYRWEAGFKKHDFLPLRISYLVGYKASDNALSSQTCPK